MGRPQKPIDKTQLQAMYWEQGMSVQEISQSLEVSYETVRKRMQFFSIPRRPSGPAKLDPNRTECDNGHLLDDRNRYVSSQGRIICRACRNDRSRYYYSKEHNKCLDKARERVARNPDKASAKNRDYRLKKFGLTVETYEQMVLNQNGVCAICGEVEKEISHWTGEPFSLAVDHSHKTGKVRELLCHRCNRLLGIVDDNTSLLEKVAAYLQRHSSSEGDN